MNDGGVVGFSKLEHEFPLPDGSGVWLVRAYEFATPELAKDEWERIQNRYRGTEQGNFSIWRMMTVDRKRHAVAICGRPEEMVEVGGIPYELSYEEAVQFVIRRAKVGADAFDQHGPHHHEQEARYGENSPMVIDPATGETKPYRP